MNPIKTGKSSFAYGIDRVVHFHAPLAELPARADLRPSEADSRPQLEMLLAAQTLDDWALAELLPRLANPEILTPARFAQVLREMMAALRRSASANPRAARSLGRAAGLLADEVAMRELLDMYRNALVQG
jgi:type III secretion protein X